MTLDPSALKKEIEELFQNEGFHKKRSRFSKNFAFFLEKKEIAHFHSPTAGIELDLRIGKKIKSISFKMIQDLIVQGHQVSG